MKYLIIPDVHEKYEQMLTALENEDRVNEVIFLGDFFDSWNGITEDTHRIVTWLQKNVGNPKYHFIWGNHDLHYAYPYRDELRCSGFRAARLAIIEGHLGLNHWNKFSLLKKINANGPWFISHAGFSYQNWQDSDGLSEVKIALKSLVHAGPPHRLLLPGPSRGGPVPCGGLTWCDWDEFKPIPGVNQIVGHTEGELVRTKIGLHSVNYCLDTRLQHVAILSGNGTLVTLPNYRT